MYTKHNKTIQVINIRTSRHETSTETLNKYIQTLKLRTMFLSARYFLISLQRSFTRFMFISFNSFEVSPEILEQFSSYFTKSLQSLEIQIKVQVLPLYRNIGLGPPSVQKLRFSSSLCIEIQGQVPSLCIEIQVQVLPLYRNIGLSPFSLHRNIGLGPLSIQKYRFRSSLYIEIQVQVLSLYGNIGLGLLSIQKYRFRSSLCIEIQVQVLSLYRNIGLGPLSV